MADGSGINFNEKVYGVVRRIPRGKVATYGQIAAIMGRPRSAREVGWALHANRDVKTPCHRVVDRTGRLAPNFGGPALLTFSAKGGPASGWDGAEEQRRRLEQEGVDFVDSMHVDLAKSLWKSI